MDLSKLYRLINEAQENFENDKTIFDGDEQYPLHSMLRPVDGGFVVICILDGEETYRTDVYMTEKEALDAYIEFCQAENEYTDLIDDMLCDEDNFMNNDASQYVLKALKQDLDEAYNGDWNSLVYDVAVGNESKEAIRGILLDIGEIGEEDDEETIQEIIDAVIDEANDLKHELQDLDEAFLTKQDKKLLLDAGHKEEDLDQIQQAADKRKTTYTIDGKDATREEVIKLLGREKYLHGLSRSAFHYTASQKQDDKEVEFDSSKLFE